MQRIPNIKHILRRGIYIIIGICAFYFFYHSARAGLPAWITIPTSLIISIATLAVIKMAHTIISYDMLLKEQKKNHKNI